MPTYIIVILVLFILFLIWGYMGLQKKKEVTLSEEQRLKETGIALTKKTTVFSGTIGIDEPNRKLVLISNRFNKAQSHVIDFADIMQCDLVKDGQSVFKKSAMRTVGGVLVGGVLGGGIGAVVGGLSGSSTEKQIVKKIELKLVVRDLSNSTLYFSFFDNEHQSVLPEMSRQAEMWKDTVAIIIDQEDARQKGA